LTAHRRGWRRHCRRGLRPAVLIGARPMSAAAVSVRTLAICAWLGLAAWTSVQAEPYFAVREGRTCASCHVNPSGGGLRNTFGTTWGQTVLPAGRIEDARERIWTGEVGDHLRIGGNLRSAASYVDVPAAKPANG